MKTIALFLFVIPILATAQNFPISPNKLDENGNRHGHWTVLYDTAWKEVHAVDSAKFYRLIRYENGKPSGKVRDFYKNGTKQWDGYFLSLNPDVYDGEVNYYYENGKVQYTRTYVNGKWNGFNLEYSILGKLLKREPYKDGLVDGMCTYFYEDGSKYSEFLFKQNVANGPATFYYPSGKLKSKFFLKNNERDGLKEDYDENGKIKTRLFYAEGKLQNDYEDFFPDGTIKEKGKFKNDKREGFWIENYNSGKTMNKGNYKEGLQEGTWSYYYENGNLKKTGTYKNDNSEGEWRYYFESGKLQSVVPYRNGKAEGQCSYYYENEKLKSRGQRKNSLAEGEWISYFNTGQVSDVSNYLLDSLNGSSVDYYENGLKKSEGFYKKGLKHGYFKYYFENGNLKSEGTCNYDKREGLWAYYYEDGSKDATENYKDGELDGEYKSYYADGALKQQAFFKAGKVEGVALKYHPNGKLRKREEFINNKTHGKLETFFEDGTKERVANYYEGKINGSDLCYYPNGKLKTVQNYVNDIENGDSEIYYDNGQLQTRGTIKNGVTDGHFVQYYRNGKLMLEKDVRSGVIDGFTVLYDSVSGKVKTKGLYVKSKMHGKWLAYDEKRKRKTTYYYLGHEENQKFVKDSVNRLVANNDYTGALRAMKWLEAVTKRDAKTQVDKAVPLYMYGSVYADAGDYNKSLYYYKKRLAAAEKYENELVNHKSAIHNVGYALQYLGRFDEALSYIDRAIEMSKKFDITDYWDSNIQKAFCLYDAKRAEAAEALLDTELSKALKRYGDSTVAWVFRKDVAGYFYNRPSNYAKAKLMYLSLLKDIHHHQQPDHEIAGRSFYILGNIFQRESEYEMAKSYYDSSVSYAERNKTTTSTRYAESLLGLYDVIKGSDSLSSAKRKEVISKIRKAVTSAVDHDILSRMYRTLQVYEYDYGTYAPSLTYAKEAIDETIKAGKENSLLHANILQTEAWCRYYTNKRDYSLAESLFEKAVEIRRKLYGEISDNYYLSKMVLGSFYQNISRFQKAEQTLNEVMPLLILSGDQQNIANIERYLGEINYNQGKYNQALPHFETALQFYEANQKDFPDYYRNVLGLLAKTYEGLDKYEQAKSCAEKAYNHAVAVNGKLSESALLRMESLAAVHQYFSVYTEAQKLYQQYAESCKTLYGENSSEYLNGLIDLAAVYRLKGERQKSVELLLPFFKKLDDQPSSSDYLSVVTELADASTGAEEESYRKKKLKCYKDLFGEGNYNYAKYLNELGELYSRQYRMEEAENAMTTALKMVMKTEYGTTYFARDFYSSLARLKSSLDKNKEAEELFLEEISITEKDTLNHPVSYELSCEDLSNFYSKMGRHADAEKVLRKMLQLVERSEGKSFYYHRTRWNLAMECMSQQKYEEARDLCNSVTKTVEEEYGVNNWLALDAHNSLGLIAFRQNDFILAKSEFLKCLYGYQSVPNPSLNDQAWISNCRFNAASASVGLGQFREAEDWLNKSDSLRRRYSIITSNSLAMGFLKARANVSEAKGDFQKAEDFWNQLQRKLLNYTNNNFYYMSDEEKAQFWKEQGNTFRQFQSFAVRRSKQNPAILGTMYNVQLATKAILLSSSNKIRKRIFSGNDTAMISMYYRWQQKRDRLAQLYSTPLTTQEYLASVDSLKSSINRIEKELNIAAEDLEADKGGKLVDWKEVQRVLSPSEAAIEIIRYKNYDRYERDSVIYVALILTSETKTAPELVILPNGKMLEGRGLKFYKNAVASQIDDKSSYGLYWADIGLKLKNKSRLYLSLDGVYNSINLNTLRDAEGKFIVDSKNLTLLANTKDLLVLKGKRRSSSASASASLVGFPTYFLGKEKIKKNLSKQRDFDFSKLSDEDRSGISELPGTKTEIEKVNLILKSHHWQVASYTDEAATEKAVKEIRQPKLVHIATHGYFTNDGSNTASNTDPMLRAGLLFTGASNFLQDKISTTADNGILTAYEAANLNLDNTDLVVLSACETGKGEVQNGEGVYGLQRAFQTAGAQAIIMSLWKVDDEATQELMTSFYKNWMKGSTKADAFREAQLQLKNKYTHPYYWGAFVMMGN